MLDLGKLLAQVEKDLGYYRIEKISACVDGPYVLEIWANPPEEAGPEVQNAAAEKPIGAAHVQFNAETSVLVLSFELGADFELEEYGMALDLINSANADLTHGVRMSLIQFEDGMFAVMCSMSIVIPASMLHENDAPLQHLIGTTLMALLQDGLEVVDILVEHKPLIQ